MAAITSSCRVPASTSNLGPGFDTLGVALSRYNTVTVSEIETPVRISPMMQEAVTAFFDLTKDRDLKPFPVSVSVSGDIPVSRGLGSSVTVRLGLLLSLAVLAGERDCFISREEVLTLAIELEGHPDNAVPSCLGGLAICSKKNEKGFGFTRVEVAPELTFVALVPDLELCTEKARGLLPMQIPFRHAIENMQNTARIATCLALQRYEDLRGLFGDHLHQPYRSALIPGFTEILSVATEAGALGSFLSGAGSTLMALTYGSGAAIGEAMLQTSRTHGLSAEVLYLHADNLGATISLDRPAI